MCEFKVFLNNEKIMEDVVFAEVNKDGVFLRDIVGESKFFKNALIIEVNTLSGRIMLESR